MNTMIRKTMFVMSLVLCFAGVHSHIALGQSMQVPAAPTAEPMVIMNATIHTITNGTIDRGYIVMRDGKIDSIGSGDYPRSRDIKVIDATDLHVYPGLVSTDTTLGLTEIGSVRATVDTNEVGEITPEVRASIAINPDSALIPVARANGILTALVVPQSGAISGYASIVRLDGWTTEEMAIKDRAAMVVRWPRTRPSRAWWSDESDEDQMRRARENLDRIDRVFRDAAAYLQARRADADAHPMDVRLEAFRPVLEGDAPLFVYATQATQIRSAIAWSNRNDFDITIVGGSEADQCTDMLVAHDVPVIITGTHRMPSRRDAAYDEAYRLPLALHEAGVRFCIASGSGASSERNLPYQAAMAASYGLPVDVALETITIRAAELLGLGATHGSLEEGKHATLMITTGNPLEITSDVLDAFIEGTRIDLGSKHKALYEKYQARYRQMGLID